MIFTYAKEKDFKEIRRLWQMIFTEDTDEYLDFYEEYVMPNNQMIIVKENETSSRIIAMLHLNPYEVVDKGEQKNIYYIVAVATLPEFRRRGIMKRMLQMAQEKAAIDHIDTLVLLPADERYYKPFGYSFASTQYNTSIMTTKYPEKAKSGQEKAYKICDEESFIKLFTKNEYKSNKNITACPKTSLARRLYAEVKADQGEILAYQENLLLLYPSEDKVTLRKYYLLEDRNSETYLSDISDLLTFYANGRLLIIHEPNEPRLRDYFPYSSENQYDYRPYMMLLSENRPLESPIGFDEIV